MKKYEIYTDDFQFHFGRGRDSIPAMTGDEILDTYLSCDDRITANIRDPRREASFDSLEDALAEWEKNYKNYGSSSAAKSGAVWQLMGRLAYLEANEYDEDGEFDQGGEIYVSSAGNYIKPEK